MLLYLEHFLWPLLCSANLRELPLLHSVYSSFLYHNQFYLSVNFENTENIYLNFFQKRLFFSCSVIPSNYMQ